MIVMTTRDRDNRRGTEMFHDSFNFVFYIVGEYISCAADTHLATDLTCKR